MSLIRLLTTTRSLSDVKNEPSPYRMTQQGLLPKFGPKRRAEAGGGDEAARRDASPDPQSGDAKENLGEGNGNRTDAGCSLKSESGRKARALAGWWQKLFRRRARREGVGPVQAEFTLDLVKVVRNDLSDADATAGKPEKRKPLTPAPSPSDEEREDAAFGVPRG